jgi:hypothetical protein
MCIETNHEIPASPSNDAMVLISEAAKQDRIDAST